MAVMGYWVSSRRHKIPLVEDARMSPQKERLRTLIVDDSELALHTICSYLEDLPWVQVVGTAMDGVDALLLAAKHHPDLVLLDLQMPGMSGLEVASRLASDFPGILVVIVTGLDAPKLGLRLSDRGVYGLVSKQRMHQELPEVLDQILHSSAS
jgi:two-component system, NarL family, response regulator DesR